MIAAINNHLFKETFLTWNLESALGLVDGKQETWVVNQPSSLLVGHHHHLLFSFSIIMLLGKTWYRVIRWWIWEHTNLSWTPGSCPLLTTQFCRFVSQFPHLQNGDYNNSNLIGLFWEINEMLYLKWLTQWVADSHCTKILAVKILLMIVSSGRTMGEVLIEC